MASMPDLAESQPTLEQVVELESKKGVPVLFLSFFFIQLGLRWTKLACYQFVAN